MYKPKYLRYPENQIYMFITVLVSVEISYKYVILYYLKLNPNTRCIINI